MKEIGYIQGTAFFMNRAGNPNDLDQVLERLYRLVDEGSARVEDPVFVYYLDRIAEDMVKSTGRSVGPDPMRSLTHRIFLETSNRTEFPEEDFRFYLFYILCRLHQNLEDHGGALKLAERYESEFNTQPYYSKITSLSLLNSTDTTDLNRALESAYEGVQAHSRYPELHKVLAESIVEIVESGITYTGSNSDIPSQNAELLELGKRRIDRALEASKHPTEYLIIKGRLEAVDSRYDEALESIKTAKSELSRSRSKYEELRTELVQLESSIKMRRRQENLESKTTELSNSVNDLQTSVNKSQSSIEQIDEQLDNIRQKFQRTFLEFLGFFSGIIAIIVITGQIAISVADPQVAGRLIIASYGGLLFAFGGFGVILSSQRVKARNRAFISIIGLAVAAISIIL